MRQGARQKDWSEQVKKKEDLDRVDSIHHRQRTISPCRKILRLPVKPTVIIFIIHRT